MNDIDRLNDLLVDAECELEEHCLGVSAEVPLDDGALVWKKKGAEWQLVYRNQSGTEAGLLLTSKKIRVLAAHQLGALLEALRAEADRQFGGVAESIELVSAFINHCRRARGMPELSLDSGSETPR